MSKKLYALLLFRFVLSAWLVTVMGRVIALIVDAEQRLLRRQLAGAKDALTIYQVFIAILGIIVLIALLLNASVVVIVVKFMCVALLMFALPQHLQLH